MNNIVSKVMVNGEKAVYRTAARTLVSNVKKAIIKMMEDKDVDQGTRSTVSKLLQSEIGDSLIGAVIGVGLPHVPIISEDVRVQRISQEFQVEALSVAMDSVISTITDLIIPVIGDAIKSLPEVKEEEEEEEIQEENSKVSNSTSVVKE